MGASRWIPTSIRGPWWSGGILLGALCVCVGVGACGDDPEEGSGRREQGSATVGGDVVSTVDGMPITVDEVRRVVRETELGPRDALERLQERELLAMEARRQGRDDGPEVERATKQAMVQALLRREVEEAIGPLSITEEAIAARYESRADLAEERGVTLDDARESIREQLLLEARRERYEELVRHIEERYPVERNPESIRDALERDLADPADPAEGS